MIIPNCITPRDMAPDEAAYAIHKLSQLLGGNMVGIGIWEGSIKGAMTGNVYEGGHVSAFDRESMIAPFGPHGDQRSEAAAMLFAIANNNAAALAMALNRDFSVDASLVEEAEQVASITRAADSSGAPTGSAGHTVIQHLAAAWTQSVNAGEDINDLLNEIETTMIHLREFRSNVIQQIEAAPKIDLVQNLIDRVNAMGLDPSDLDELVDEVFANSATNRANNEDNPRRQDEVITEEEYNASTVNNGGIDEQVLCLVNAYGIAGATHQINSLANGEDHKAPPKFKA